MENQIPNTPVNTPVDTHNHVAKKHTFLYVALGLLAVAVILLVSVVGGMYFKGKSLNSELVSLNNALEQDAHETAAAPTAVVTPTPIDTRQVTPAYVSTKEDLTVQQKALDGVDTAEISTGLEENSKESSSFQ